MSSAGGKDFSNMDLLLETDAHEWAPLRQLLQAHGYGVTARASGGWRLTRGLQGRDVPFCPVCEEAPFGIFRFSPEGKLLEINAAGARMYKFASPQEMIAAVNRTSVFEALCSEAEKVRTILDEVLAADAWHLCEARLLAKDGGEVDCQLRLRTVRDHQGRPVEIEGFCEDITERKQAEAHLRLTRFSIEKTNNQVFWMGEDGRFFYVNDAACRSLGYSREELLQMSVSDIDPNVPPDLFAGHWQDLKKNGSLTLETYHRTRDGRVYPVEVRANYLEFDGKAYNCAFVTDISERKRTEDVITARMRLLQFAAMHTLDELLEATLDEAEKLTGSQIGFFVFFDADQQTLIFQNWSTRTKREYCTAQGKGLHFALAEAGVWSDCIHQRCPVIHNDYLSLPHRKGLPPGHAPLIREVLVPVFRGDRIVAIVAVGNKPEDYTSHDVEAVSLLADLAWTITEHKQAEEALRESERRYRSIVEHAPFGITHSTRDGKLISVNPALAAILKYDSAEQLQERVSRSSIQDVLFPDPSDRLPLVEKIFAQDGWYVFNNRLRCRDGSIVTCRVHSRPILDKDGQATTFESFQENISEQIQAEQALRESEEKFRVLAETSPVSICIYQGEHLIYLNPAMERLFGYSAEEWSRMEFWQWAHPEDQAQIRRRGYLRLAGGAAPGEYEARYRTKDGAEGYVLVSAGMIDYQGRTAVVGTFLDITERKRTETLIRASLQEKEMLLREIHHRVKNNLQVVSSLLFLQSQKFADEELQSCFLESQSRICSMALAHELLYQSKNLAELSIKNYMENLADQLQQILPSSDQKIVCRLAVEDIDLDIAKVVPCGLLVTELLSNAYKHAFVDGRAGRIEVSLQRRGGKVELAVADDGVGLPESFDFQRATTLGLQLVAALVNQLNGSLEVCRSGGTRFCIQFAG